MKEINISGKTRICGIIGDPIEHTLSPAMHNSMYRSMNLDFVYLPFKVKSTDLDKAIAGMKALNFRGLNVTIPHKVAVMPFLDKMDILADKIGAVNTIINDNGILTGYNTDAQGFLKALVERDIRPAGKNVLLLGAGGAARAIGFILSEERTRLTILNRKEELSWATDLAKCLSQTYSGKVKAVELSRKNLEKLIPSTDLLVNATSVGMSPNNNESPVPNDLLCANLVVFDIVYNPYQTRLLREAKEAGALTINGLDMLVWQGVLAFEKFTGKKVPFELMREAALKELPMKSNAALVGFMGTGKTSVGQELAKKMGWQFVEVDALIEQMAGKSIPDMFASDGEITFREWEIEAIKQVARGRYQVISCGGGAVLNTINIARLKETSVMILLTASPDTVLKRTAADRDTRPVLMGAEDPAARIKELLKFRKPYYERSADIFVNTSKLSLTEVADLIIGKLKNYEGFDFKK